VKAGQFGGGGVPFGAALEGLECFLSGAME